MRVTVSRAHLVPAALLLLLVGAWLLLPRPLPRPQPLLRVYDDTSTAAPPTSPAPIPDRQTI